MELLIDRKGHLCRVAVLADGRLVDIYVDHAERPQHTGAIYLGRITQISAQMNAAFVDLGLDRAGYLPAADVRPLIDGGRRGAGHGERTEAGALGNRLVCGQTVVVQVRAEGTGSKGPALTMDVTLPGRLLVHAPLGDATLISRRVTDGGQRAELKERIDALVEGGGWIARLGAASADTEALQSEIATLAGLWQRVRQAGAAASAPALLLPAPDALQRAIVAQGVTPIRRILIEDGGGSEVGSASATAAGSVPGNAAGDAPVTEGWRALAPELAAVVSSYRGPPALFDHRDLDEALSALLDPCVSLPSGGYLVIERTEALTAIDVNSGDAGNPLTVNLEAAAEVGRQIRLRNLSGIIVVDFLRLRRNGDQSRLFSALSQAVGDDPAQVHVYGMTRLGLVEMTRSRRGASLADLIAAE